MTKNPDPQKAEINMALGIFAEAIIENLQQSQDPSQEAFEGYEMYLRGAIHRNAKEFKSRFIKGYFALINKKV